MPALLSAVLAFEAPARAAVSLQGVGVLPGESASIGAAGSGTLIVGWSFDVGTDGTLLSEEAFRWDPVHGIAGLGFLPGEAFSQAIDVALDGSIVAGHGYTLDSQGRTISEQACIWSAIQGVVGLGFLPGDFVSKPFALSRDGSTVVGGSGGFHSQVFVEQAFVWDAVHGMRGLGLLPGGTNTEAQRVSRDGSIVAGHGFTVDAQGRRTTDQAFVWDAVSGLRGLGFLPGESKSRIRLISEDGSVVVGDSYTDDARGTITDEAFVWDAVHGMRGLGFLPGESVSKATGATSDASVVVGGSATLDAQGQPLTNEGFVWDAVNGMRGLGLLPGYARCSANNVAEAGGAIVGACSQGSTGPLDGFVWDAQHGMRSVADVFGAAANGWTRLNPAAIFGRMIAGNATDPGGHEEAWLADLPEPSAGWLDAGALAALAGLRRRRQLGRPGVLP